MMDLNKKEIDKYVFDTFKNNELKKVNNIYLSNKQMSILDKYMIDYKYKDKQSICNT